MTMTNDRKSDAKSEGERASAAGHRDEGDEIVPVAIGQKLRKLYDGVASEPVPDRFLDLLEQLEKSGGNKQ